MIVQLRRELECAVALARRAGELVRSRFRGELAIERKTDGSPVTDVDREANTLLVAGLSAAFPGDGLLSEEAPDDGSRQQRPRVWMIDPIDGTTDFIRGRDGFSVMIGLVAAAGPLVGVVYQPIGDKLYYATRGEGAFMAREGGLPTRLRVSSIAAPAQLRMVASKSHRTALIDRVRSELGITDELNVGSVGLKLGLIAEGTRDLYVNPAGHSKLWDTAGPEVILTEAGGRLTDAHGAPLDYHGAEIGNVRGLVASNGRLHQLVIERLASLFPPGPMAG